jgi:hypothetical protein
MSIDEAIAVRAQLDTVATALTKAYKAVKPTGLPSSAENVLRFKLRDTIHQIDAMQAICFRVLQDAARETHASSNK